MSGVQLACGAIILFRWRGVVRRAYGAALAARRVAVGARWLASMAATAVARPAALEDTAAVRIGVGEDSDSVEEQGGGGAGDEWVVIDTEPPLNPT